MLKVAFRQYRRAGSAIKKIVFLSDFASGLAICVGGNRFGGPAYKLCRMVAASPKPPPSGLTAMPASADAADFSAQRLDVQAFASIGGVLAGAHPLPAMARLLDEAHPGAAAQPAAWQARGTLRAHSGGPDQVWLHLQAQMALNLTCQRCLEAVLTPLTVAQDYRFVADEATAEREDDASEEDVLALATDLDLLALLEDELLMALPISPRHDACPRVLPGLQTTAKDSAPHPFAALQVLKDKL